MARRAGYENYSRFPARFDQNCHSCAKRLRQGLDVLGSKIGGQWHIVCIACGDTAQSGGAVAQRGTAPPTRAASGRVPVSAEQRGTTPWSILVNYLRSCVIDESLAGPVPLNARDRWAPFPLDSETVLCGGDDRLPAPAGVRKLFDNIEDGALEGVFYGWPTVVVLDRKRRAHIAPLFVRPLAAPIEPTDGEPYIPVSHDLPRLNSALLHSGWFAPEMLSAAAKVIANNVIGFGATAAMTATAKAVLGALGIPEAVLDPLKLLPVDPDKELWLPQEVGVFNLVMAFRGQVDIAVQSLLADLRWMETAPDWHNSAARFLFDDVTPPATGLLEACSVRLNHAQEIALDAAAHNPLTVITGPPGTGKSQTVTAIVAEAWRRGESVVLSSTNNRPVDDVVNTKATDIDAGLMLRTGNKEVRGKLSEAVYDLLPEVVARQPEEGAEQAVQVCASQRHLAAHVLEQRAKLESGLLDASLLRDELRALVWEDRQPRVPITEIDKRAAKAVRTRWKWLRRRRAAKLREVAGLPSTIAVEAIIEWTRSESVFDSAWQTLGAHQRDNEGDLLDAFQQADMRWRAASRVLTSELVRRGYTDGAEHLKLLADKLSEELPFREVMTQVLRHVHGWATSTLSTRPSFDCRAGSIDLVVIDEASQCTLAQILPLAFRAKRLVIVGDADQLPPVITATPERLRALATDAGASHEQFAAMHHTYGEHSAFDAFAARFKPEPLLLNEHYRCHPDIIRFCNEEFYDGKLVVLSEVDDREDLGLTWIDITGVTRPGRTGSVVNEFEVDAVVNWLAESELDLKHTGVVTPFRAQANMIERALAAHPDERLRAVEVGTAHTFQGGERETILFSTVISTDAQPGTIGWLESQRNLVNVAVSRAKHRLIVFGDALAIRTRGPRVLRTLAETATATATGHATTGDVLTDRVRAALTAKGIPSRRGQLVQGYPVEIAITGADGELIDVEISRYPDGDTGARQQRRDAVRDTRLRGLGWRVVRVPGWQAYLDPAAIIDQVRTMRDPRT